MTNTREKLIGLLETVPPLDAVIMGLRNGKQLISTSRVADHLIANGVTIQKWIPVSERLPEKQQRVLVYCESKTIRKHITSCTYMGGYLGSKQWSRHVRNVTHWMPLPEPPAEK